MYYYFAEKWALCHRRFDHHDTDTNMLVERLGQDHCFVCLYYAFVSQSSFHNKLKTNPRYLNHHANRRCDDLIEVLMRIEEDMFYERKRKEVMQTSKHASFKSDGKERHTFGRDICDSTIKVSKIIQHAKAVSLIPNYLILKVLSENQYQIPSVKQDTLYTVHVLARNCLQQPQCIPHCDEPECGYLCRHMVQCTCIDYVQGHLCKHAHKVNNIPTHFPSLHKYM